MLCIGCGFKNHKEKKHCEYCGIQLSIQGEIQYTDVDSSTLNCPECGEENRPGVNFCEACGFHIATIAASEKSVSTISHELSKPDCPECGMSNRANVNFCEECGFAFPGNPELQKVNEEPQRIINAVNEIPATSPSVKIPKRSLGSSLLRWVFIGGTLGLLGIFALTSLGNFRRNGEDSSNNNQGITSNSSFSGTQKDDQFKPTIKVSPSAGNENTVFDVDISGFPPNYPIFIEINPYAPGSTGIVLPLGKFAFKESGVFTVFESVTDSSGQYNTRFTVISDPERWSATINGVSISEIKGDFIVIVEPGDLYEDELCGEWRRCESNVFSLNGGFSSTNETASEEVCPVSNATEMKITPTIGFAGDSFTITGALGGGTSPGESYTMEYHHEANNGPLLFSHPITLQSDCNYSASVVAEPEDEPGEIFVLIVDSNNSIYASDSFYITE